MINNYVKNKTKKFLTLTLLASFICASSNVFAVKNSAELPIDTTGRKANHYPDHLNKKTKTKKSKPSTPSTVHVDIFTQTTPVRPTTPIETQTDPETSTEEMVLDQLATTEATVSQETQSTIIPATIIDQPTEQVNESAQDEAMNLENSTPTLENPNSPLLGQQTLRQTQPSKDPEDPRDPRRGAPGVQRARTNRVKKFITEIPNALWMFVKKHPLLTLSGVTIVATTTGYFLVPSIHNAINSGVHNLGVFAFNKLGQLTGEMPRLQSAHQSQTALQQAQITGLQTQLTNAIQYPQCPQIQYPTCPTQTCPTCPAPQACPTLNQQLNGMSFPRVFIDWLRAHQK